MINLQVSAAPLPSNFRGTPQQLIQAFLDRLKITSDAVTVTISDTQPTDNSPWFKNGTQLWVWDTNTSTYIPLDLSASTEDEISIGAVEPNPDKFLLWLKTDGETVVGLYTYMGTTAGWVTQQIVAVIEDNAVTTAKIANSAVTTAKIANLAVTAAKLAAGIPLTKFELGAALAHLRMNVGGTAAVWVSDVIIESAITLNSVVEVPHGLTDIPGKVEVVLFCDDAAGEYGYAQFDEINISSVMGGSSSPTVVFKDATNVGVIFGTNLNCRRRDNTDQQNLTAAKWKVRFTVTPF